MHSRGALQTNPWTTSSLSNTDGDFSPFFFFSCSCRGSAPSQPALIGSLQVNTNQNIFSLSPSRFLSFTNREQQQQAVGGQLSQQAIMKPKLGNTEHTKHKGIKYSTKTDNDLFVLYFRECCFVFSLFCSGLRQWSLVFTALCCKAVRTSWWNPPLRALSRPNQHRSAVERGEFVATVAYQWRAFDTASAEQSHNPVCGQKRNKKKC